MARSSACILVNSRSKAIRTTRAQTIHNTRSGAARRIISPSTRVPRYLVQPFIAVMQLFALALMLSRHSFSSKVLIDFGISLPALATVRQEEPVSTEHPRESCSSGPGAPLLHRQSRLGAIEGLNLALLIDRQDNGVQRLHIDLARSKSLLLNLLRPSRHSLAMCASS
jgi:hypothetical protein